LFSLTLLVAFSRYFAVNIRPDWLAIAFLSDAIEAANDRWEDMVKENIYRTEPN
jgi:hypothetical protein